MGYRPCGCKELNECTLATEHAAIAVGWLENPEMMAVKCLSKGAYRYDMTNSV